GGRGSSSPYEMYELEIVALGNPHLRIPLTTQDVPVVLHHDHPGLKVEAVEQLLDREVRRNFAPFPIQPDIDQTVHSPDSSGHSRARALRVRLAEGDGELLDRA